MGLDMYLTANRYVGGWKHSKEDEKDTYNGIAKLIGKEGWKCENSPHLEVNMSVAYWRKANCIHKWFVDNVQKGKDDRGRYYVSVEQLKQLRDTCQSVLNSTTLKKGVVNNGIRYENGNETPILENGEILADTTVAEKLLPCQSGFFFGSTEYNQWYWRDLQNTVTQLDKVLAEFKDWEFEYHSSW